MIQIWENRFKGFFEQYKMKLDVDPRKKRFVLNIKDIFKKYWDNML